MTAVRAEDFIQHLLPAGCLLCAVTTTDRKGPQLASSLNGTGKWYLLHPDYSAFSCMRILNLLLAYFY